MDISKCFTSSFVFHEIDKAKESSLLETTSCHLCIKKETTTLFLYGKIPLVFFKTLKQWLAESFQHAVYFCDTDPSVLKAIFNKFKDYENRLQAKFCLEKYESEQFFIQLGWDLVFKGVELLCFDSDKGEQFSFFKQKVLSSIRNVFGIVSETKDFYKSQYFNTFKNAQLLSGSFVLSHFKESLKDIPAVICGAGESLKQDASVLKQFKDKAVIFAGGSAIRILSDLKIQFHMALALDPDPLYIRFQNLQVFQPIFITLLRNAPFFNKIFHGETILALEEENFLEKDLLQEMGLSYKGLDYGWNVGNFQAFVASFLGCNPIIMTGMDMGFQGSEYALELEEEGKRHENFQNVFSEEEFFSRKDLVLGKEYLEKLALFFSDIDYVQSNHSVITPKGFKKQSLLTLCNNLPQRDISGHIHQTLYDSNKVINFKTFISKYELEFKNDMSKAIKIFESIKNICESLQDKGITSKNFKQEYLALEEYELENLKTFQVLLQPLWTVWKHLLFRDRAEGEGILEKTIQKYAFFQRVVKEMSSMLDKV